MSYKLCCALHNCIALPHAAFDAIRRYVPSAICYFRLIVSFAWLLKLSAACMTVQHLCFVCWSYGIDTCLFLILYAFLDRLDLRYTFPRIH